MNANKTISMNDRSMFIRIALLLALIFITTLILTGCGQTAASSATASLPSVASQPPEQTNENTLDADGYLISNLTYEASDRIIEIHYPQITGYKGELLMDYMNQSLKRPIEALIDDPYYRDLKIDFRVTRKDDEILSVILTGTGTLDGARAFNYLQSVNLDLNTSNEITFENFVKEDPASRQAFSEVLDQSAMAAGLPEGAEYESLRFFFKGDDVIFYYMPLDDSAESFVEISVPLVELEGLIESDFGERPAS